eukprot:TRINITY_DN11110_c0_g1_i1.p1 TRINITY_DN11110_c0_g1~~TRINITY_DN11110_c0_g1_i1.p1  ORF type:complete len:175 (-),score=44.42 TRINITY_DN11110_c0_g1_i1:41-565(-)
MATITDEDYQHIEIEYHPSQYAATPYTWDILQSKHNKPNTSNVRDEYTMIRYLKYLKYCKEQNYQMGDIVDELVFSGQTDKDADRFYIGIMVNNFPYYLEEDIKHYNLWMRGAYKERYHGDYLLMIDLVKDEIEDLKGVDLVVGENIVWFENDYSAKSIPERDHIHFFVRKLDE